MDISEYSLRGAKFIQFGGGFHVKIPNAQQQASASPDLTSEQQIVYKI